MSSACVARLAVSRYFKLEMALFGIVALLGLLLSKAG